MSSNPGWDMQSPPPARGGSRSNGQVAANHDQPVTEDELAQYDHAWQQAEVREQQGGYTDLPDGKYIGKIAVARLDHTKTNGHPMFVLAFEVVAGPASGDHYHRRVIRDAESVKFIKQDLWNLGLYVPLLSQLPLYCPGLINCHVEFVLKTKPGKDGQARQNTYVNRYIPDEELRSEVEQLTQVPF